jgi:hypothetical protein
MTNVDYTASTSKIPQPSFGGTLNLVHGKTTGSGQLATAGLLLEWSGYFKRFAIPTSTTVFSTSNKIFLAGSKRLWGLRGSIRYIPCYSVTSLQLLVADIHLQTSAGALRNVINDSSSFMDSSSTALIASVTFRLAVLNGNNSTHISNASAAYNFVYDNIDSNGWLRNTVDPLTFDTLSQLDDPSPEGQSFVLLLEAARRDFQDWVESSATLPSDAGGHQRNCTPRIPLSALATLWVPLFLLNAYLLK